MNIQVAVTTRVDVTLGVGQTTESIEVKSDASMLKTETRRAIEHDHGENRQRAADQFRHRRGRDS